MERVHKSPELPKTLEKLKSSAHHDLGNIHNATPSMHLINTPLLYRKDNSRGLSSSVCTDLGFSTKKSFFLRKELENKQKTIDNLLNINYMHPNSNEPGNNSYKTANAQSGQINATSGEQHFQMQNRNNLTVGNNTYKDKRERKDITLSQNQSERLRNEEIQQHRDIENKSIITIENQLIEFRQKKQDKFKELKNPHRSPNSNENLQIWSRNTTLIVWDSMLSGIDERRISKRDRKVKAKNFPGATIDDMYDYIKQLLKKCPDKIILHLGTNNTVNESLKVVLGKLHDLKKSIENSLPESKVIISNLITRTNNGKAFLTVV